MDRNGLAKRIREHMSECNRKMPVAQEIVSGTLSMEDLRRHAKRHHAEIRTFIDFKLPERLRLCPAEAITAKKYFSDLYIEEQGHFVPGQNHADIFMPVCRKLGISDYELEKEYQSYWPRYQAMLSEHPSHQVLVRELAISCAWESLLMGMGEPLIAGLKNIYGFSDNDLIYFSSHAELDQRHSGYACEILQNYITDDHLEQIALNAITDTLLKQSYFDL